MNTELITILLAFIEGFALILSPCILPVLPLILAGSLTGSTKRPLGIITGFSLTFALFGYFAHSLVRYSGIDLNLVRHSAYVMLLMLAAILLSNYLSELFSRITHKIIAFAVPIRLNQSNPSGFFSGLFLGALISLLWTPCAGPILAAVIVQIVIQKETISSFFTLLSFALGAAIPMLILALYSLKIKNTFVFFKTHALLFRKALGLIIILNVAYMMHQESNYTTSADFSPSGIRTTNYLQDALWRPYPAPKIDGIDAWLNSPPLQLNDLKGKVVLIDFWTYSCINCIRTLPYIKYWYKTYHNKGLVIIGVHTPEFDFESKLANVKHAVKQHGIEYPVALDNQFVTWRNFSNHYWPAHYLINKEGKVVYEHFGEGNYDQTENNIRFLLGEGYSANNVDLGKSEYSYFTTPETYLGYARDSSNANSALIHDQVFDYSFPNQLASNTWALQGSWQVNADKITAIKANASLRINFNARKVYMVVGNGTKKTINVTLSLNGKPLTKGNGSDVINSQIKVDKYSIYQLIDLPQTSKGLLQITTSEPGLEVYTFTFGS